MEKDIIITESDEEILEYLDYKKNNIVLTEEEEEIKTKSDDVLKNCNIFRLSFC
jgi:hypothetical protein